MSAGGFDMRGMAWLGLMLIGCGGGVSGGGSCTDFVLDGNESDVDCGGSCGACGNGRACFVNADCFSGVCSGSGRCIEQSVVVVDPSNVFLVQGGAAISIVPGTQAGYGITASASGGSFRLVWTGDGNVTSQYHEFYGSVYTSGTITSATTACGGDGSCTFGSNDYLSAPYSISGGVAIDFDSVNVNDLDGFDVTTADAGGGTAEPVYFNLYIDGVYHPELVYFTDANGAINSPPSIPFGLVTQ
jgi:hypothetical protein